MKISILDTIRKQQVFKDSFWALSGSVIGKGLSLLGGILVARILTKGIYGEYGIIKNTLYYIAVFSTFGLGFTSTRFISKYKKQDPNKVSELVKDTRLITLVTSGFMALLLLVFANPVAVFLDAPHLSTPLRIAALAIVFNAFDAAQLGIMAGFGAFKENAKNTAISGIVNFCASLGLTYYLGLTGAIIALVLSFLVSCTLNRFSINKILYDYPRVWNDRKQTIKELITFSLPIALQESLYSLTHWASVVIFVKLASYGELALYSAAGQWQAIILFIPGVLRNVTLSHLSGNTDKIVDHKKTVSTMLKVNFVSSFVPFLLILFFPRFISSFYGDTFYDLPIVLIISVAIAIPNCLSNVYSQEMISRGDNWFLFWTRLAKDLLCLAIVSFLLYFFELKGAVTLCTVTLVIQTLYLFVLYFRYSKQLKQLKSNEFSQNMSV